MRIHLHSGIDGPRVSFDANELATDRRPSSHHQGVRGWFERRATAYKELWRTGEGWLIREGRAVWERLQRLGNDDEPLLAHLRSVDSVEITHASSVPADEARALWETYLASRRRRHGLWFAVNVAISPLTVVLAPLPGPNLIGYWFAYRAFHHGLILSGLRKVTRGDLPARFQPVDERPAGTTETT